jgi:hypothetical protein
VSSRDRGKATTSSTDRPPPSRSHRRGRTGRARLIVAAAILVAFAIVAPSASAAVLSHPFKESLGSAETAAFAQPLSTTVDRTTGDILVGDLGGNEKQTISFSGFAEGDTFKLEGLPTGFGGECGASATGTLTYDSGVKTTIEAELAVLCGAANVAITGSAPKVTIEYKGVFAASPISLPTCTPETGGGSCAAARVTGGHARGIYRYKPDGEGDEFPATGTNFLSAGITLPANIILGRAEFQIAVNPVDGDIYIAQGGTKKELLIFDDEGHQLTTLTESSEGAFAGKVCGVAADSAGDVYVSESGASGHIRKYEPSGSGSEPIKPSDNTSSVAAVNPCSLAAGGGPTAGSLFAVVGGKTLKYGTSPLAEDYEVYGGPSTVIAADQGAGHVYVLGGTEVKEFNASGSSAVEVEQVGQIAVGSNPTGVGVDWASQDVYTTKSGDPYVSVWGPIAGFHFLESLGSAETAAFAQPLSTTVDRTTGDILVGDLGGNEKQTISFSGFAEGDTFKLEGLPTGFGGECGASATGTLTYDSGVKTTIEAELAVLCGAANVAITGSAPKVTIEYKGVFAASPISLPTCTPETGGGSCAAARVTGGHARGIYRYKPDGEGDEFPATGTNFLSAGITLPANIILGRAEFQIAVNPVDGDIYIAQGGTKKELLIFDDEGHQLTTLTESSEGAFAGKVCGVAADSAGDVYVSESGASGHIRKYEPSGSGSEPIKPSDNTSSVAAVNPCSLAAGGGPTAGSLFAVVGGKTLKYGTSPLAEDYEVYGGPSTVIAADQGAGHVYVLGGTEVKEFNASGSSAVEVEQVGQIAVGSNPTGVGVDWASQDVYTTKSGDPCVSVWGPGPGEPIVESVNPDHGQPETEVSIEGQNLAEASSVKFGGEEAAEIISDTATKIVAKSPAGCTDGSVDVTVTTPGGTSAMSAADEFTCEPDEFQPTVTKVQPDEGASEGGAEVTITGTEFTHATAVEFGGVAATGFTVESRTEIQATAPAHAAATVHVTVTNLVDTSSPSSADEFIYRDKPAVTKVEPDAGPLAGGTEVTITGTEFTHATAVEFGGVAATGFTVESATKIKATAPAQGPGAVDVIVTNVAGSSAAVPADEFTYLVEPTVTGVSPGEGPTAGRTEVTITGTELASTQTVEFGGREAGEIVSRSATEVVVKAPEHAAGTVDITATTPGGTSATSGADHYNFVAPPAVIGVSPAVGPTVGGGAVVIGGLRLGSATRVEFGGVEAAIVESSETAIKAIAPPQAAGAVHVRVTTIGGMSSEFPADEYTYVGPQALTVTTAGSGSGSVSCDGGSCASSYPYGSVVTLSASAASGSEFTGFSGACSSTGSCTVTINGGTAVSATFDKKAEPAPAPAPAPQSTGGTGRAASSGTVSGNQASIKVTCGGAVACKGKITLKAKVKQGKKTKTVMIGKASFSVPAGGAKTVKVKITNSQVKKELNQGRTVKAQLGGSGVKSATVKLKPQKAGREGQ